MFFPSDIARMEELDRLIAAGHITEDGVRVCGTRLPAMVN
jgi:hypothetical protein